MEEHRAGGGLAWLHAAQACRRACRAPQDDEAYEAVPGSEFVIARTAHRNNTSNYFIDGRKSNFTEVTELLKGKGVDLDNNRFLILQVGGGVPDGGAGARWGC